MKTWELEDIEITAKEKPNSFFIPSKKERDGQRIGDEVRLHFMIKNPGQDEPRAERMWVSITKEKGLFSNYKGILVNQPVYIQDLNEGDEIEFSSKNIAQIIVKEGSPRWIDSSEKFALVSNKCLEPTGVIRFLYRQEAHKDGDSGWRMFTGEETDDYANNADNVKIVKVGYLLDKDPTLLTPLKGGIGSVFERSDKGAPWEKVEDWSPEE